MAPEVWYSGRYDQRADVYSFGIICWELCTFGDPYCGFSPEVYASKVAIEGLRPPLPASVSADWNSLITRCWSHDPAQRPDFGTILSNLKK